MCQVVIENPVLNSPFKEPTRHFDFDDEGITDRIIEAVETIIYIMEAARRYGYTWIENQLREGNDSANPRLPRMASKIATGSGKTVVMTMLIAWHTLDDPKRRRPNEVAFLITRLTLKKYFRADGDAAQQGINVAQPPSAGSEEAHPRAGVPQSYED